MSAAAKRYVNIITVMGIVLVLFSVSQWTPRWSPGLTLLLFLSLVASLPKFRLQGLSGTYSLNYLPILFGIFHFQLAEVLAAGVIGAATQSLLNVQKRPRVCQVLFNCANVTLSLAVCFGAVHALEALLPGAPRYGLVALAAFLYFLVNTTLVSAVLSLIEGRPIREVNLQWYFGPFAYYLIGIVFSGTLLMPVTSPSAESWLLVLPLCYLVHFFERIINGVRENDQGQPAAAGPLVLPAPAKNYLQIVLIAGPCVLILAAFFAQPYSPIRFFAYLISALVCSACKVRLPKMEGTISLGFVVLLVAIAELSLLESMIIGAASVVVQSYWGTLRKPAPIQVLFNVSAQLLATAGAYACCAWIVEVFARASLAVLVGSACVALFGCASLLLALMLALVQEQPFAAVWRRCFFWSFPYYMAGAAAAGLMTTLDRASAWPASVLVIPVLGMLNLAYRLRVSRAPLRVTA